VIAAAGLENSSSHALKANLIAAAKWLLDPGSVVGSSSQLLKARIDAGQQDPVGYLLTTTIA